MNLFQHLSDVKYVTKTEKMSTKIASPSLQTVSHDIGVFGSQLPTSYILASLMATSYV